MDWRRGRRVHLGGDPLGSANVERAVGRRAYWIHYLRRGRIGSRPHRALAVSAHALPGTDGTDLPPVVCCCWLGHRYLWRTGELWVYKLVVIANSVSRAAAVMDSR